MYPFADTRAKDFGFDVGYNALPKYTRVAALGHNPDIDAGPEDVWTGGGTYPWMTAATSLEVLSSSANDTSAGTGARTITINGLDINYNAITATVTLNGTTSVAVGTQFFRINSALVASAGSGKVNAGDLTIRDAGAGTTRAIIPAAYGITRQSQYTVAANNTLQIHSMFFCINRPTSVRDATVATYVQTPAMIYRMPLEISVNGSPYRHEGLPGIILPEKTDFGLRCTYVSSTNTDITSAWLGILKQF